MKPAPARDRPVTCSLPGSAGDARRPWCVDKSSRFRLFDRTPYGLRTESKTDTSMGRQGGMGAPPWRDLGRYLRNSPILYVNRVETPLMIVQGDMDFVPLQQGEEFFIALYRQGKRARFVRYLGEGHVLQSPANIRDMWARILEWFEEGEAAGLEKQE